jgi:hypothetical protein
MTDWTTVSIIKCMTLWNYLVALYSTFNNKCQNMYCYLKDYFYGHHDTWIFIPGHTFPLQLSNLYNTIDINWIYDNYTTTLRYYSDSDDNQVQCKFSWLSAKIRILDPSTPDVAVEYDIDDFIEQFSVHTKSTIPPSLYTVFMCWCAYTKHWFKVEDIIEFHIIDDMGEEIVLDLIDHNNSITVKRNKLYVIVHRNDENTNVVKLPTEIVPLKEEQNKKDE